MQCECVALPCKEYIFMKDTAPWRLSKYTLHLIYITEKGVYVFDRPDNSADLIPIEKLWNILKKKSGKLPNI